MKGIFMRGVFLFSILTVVCGVCYPLLMTGVSQLVFAEKANGSIIQKEDTVYGSQFIGQPFTQMDLIWGRPTNIDSSTYRTNADQALVYGFPTNLSPASEEFEVLMQQRLEKIQAAHPEMKGESVPVDLVTGSASGLDPHISLAAAKYQIKRIAKYNNLSSEEVVDIINKAKDNPRVNFLGEPVINVLEVNLMLKGK